MTIYLIPVIVGIIACPLLGIHPVKFFWAMIFFALWIVTLACLEP